MNKKGIVKNDSQRRNRRKSCLGDLDNSMYSPHAINFNRKMKYFKHVDENTSECTTRKMTEEEKIKYGIIV